MEIFRQGDVLIMKVDDESTREFGEEVPTEDGSYILAHGEVTGHAHRIRKVSHAQMWQDAQGEADALLLRVKTAVALTHEEHDTINLDEGLYSVRRQREYTPESIRMVAD